MCLNDDFIDHELGFNQYNIFRCDKNIKTSTFSRGGGVLVAVNKNLNSSDKIYINTLNVEQIFIEVSFNDLKMIIYAI